MKFYKKNISTILIWFILLIINQLATAQITVTPSTTLPFTPTNLITQVFLGQGVDVINVTYTGDNAAIGHFTGGQNIFGINEGLVMTTGAASLAGNVSNLGGSNGQANSGGTDPDLVSIAGFNINDAAIYNITFVPSADTLRFDYVFGSDEYPDFVCSINDVFGFFISGPGITGPYQNMATNIALIPGTTIPVGVNTVNGGGFTATSSCNPNNSQFYVDNDLPNAPFPFEYDGFTKILTATAIVTPCDTYNIKLAIGDAVDAIYDSGVFLAANSFGSVGLTVDKNTPNYTSTISEGCQSAEVTFRLPQPAINNYPLTYSVGGNAIMGQDYANLPLNGFIPAGQDSFTLTIDPLIDNITEGIDTILLFVSTTSCSSDTIEIYITDAQIISPVINDTMICFGDTARLDATLPIQQIGAINFFDHSPISFSGSNPASSTINLLNFPLTTYQVGAIDSVCLNITYPNVEDLIITLNAPDGSSLELSSNNGGSGNNYNNTCFTLEDTTNVTLGLAPFNGHYSPEGNWSDLNGSPINGTWGLSVSTNSNILTGTLTNWSLHFAPTYLIDYQWSPIIGIDSVNNPIVNLTPDSTTRYRVTTTDTYGCVEEDTALVSVFQPLETPQLNCAFVGSDSLTFGWQPVPNAAGYEVNIDNTGWITLSPTNTNYSLSGIPNNQPVNLKIRATDITCPSSQIDSLTCVTIICTMNIDPDTTGVSCFGDSDGQAAIITNNANGTVNYTLQNAMNSGTPQTDSIFNNLLPTGYTVIAIDSLNCTDTTSFSIPEPTILSIDSFTSTPLFCYDDGTGTLTPIVSGGTPPYSYLWGTTPPQTTATAINLQATNYPVTVTDANGCATTLQGGTSQPLPLALNIDSINVSCGGLGDGQIITDVSGGTPPYNLQWTTVNANTTQSRGTGITDTITGLSPDTYIVSLTDDNGCSTSDTINITEPTPLLITSITSTPAICSYSFDGTATLTATGGTAPYTYFWDDDTIGINNPTNNTLNSGMHYVTVEDANGCSMNDSIFINAPTAITSTVFETPASCFGIFDGSIAVTASGGTGVLAYAWNTSPVQTDTALSNLFSGQYIVTITDAAGCIAQDTGFIAGPVILSATKDSLPVTCFGGSDGAVSITPSGGTGAGTYTYTWNNNPSLSDSSLTNITAGTYSVYVADANGCARIDSMVVNTPPELLANLDSTVVSCSDFFDGTVSVAPSGGTPGYVYTWYDGTSIPIKTGLIAGFYEITLTDANNCTIFDTIEVTQPAPLLLNTDTIHASCFGFNDGKAWVTPTGGNGNYIYQWNSSPVQNTDTLFSQAAGRYQVIVTDNKGCQDSATVDIFEPDTLTVGLSQIPALCYGDSSGFVNAIANGGTTPYIYNWNIPTINNENLLDSLPAGIYQITVTDAQNCQATGSIEVTQPDPLAITLAATITSCYLGDDGTATAQVTGGVGGYQYLWNTPTPQTSSTATNLNALETYTITITDANGCAKSDSISIQQPTQLTTSTTVTPVACNGDATGSAVTLSTGGTAPYQYEWNTSPAQFSPTAINLRADEYIVTVSDAKGCMALDTIVVTEPDTISITLDRINVNCFGENTGKAWATVAGGVAPYNYTWSNHPSTTDTMFNVIAGNYTLIVTDTNDCSTTASIDITQPDTITIAFAMDSVSCHGGSDGQLSSTVVGGVGSYQYAWSNTPQDTSATNDLSAGVYVLSVTDANNCTIIDSAEVLEPLPLQLQLFDQSPTCYNGNDGRAWVDISGGTTPYAIQWSNASSSTIDTIENLTGGANYSVTITDANNCIATASITITNPDTLTLAFTSTDEFCQVGANGTATVLPTGGVAPYSYTWNDQQTTTTATGLTTNTYSITTTDALGCTATGSVEVGFSSGITTFVTTDNVACKGDATGSASIDATSSAGALLYDWGANANNQSTRIATNLTAGRYIVTITDANGCEEQDTAIITEPAEALQLIIDTVIDVSCYDEQDAYVRVLGAGGVPAYVFSFDDNDFGNVTAWSGLAPNTYTFAVRDANNCVVEQSVNITEPAPFLLDLGEDVTIDIADTFTAAPIIQNGVEPFAYAWQPADSSLMDCTDCPTPTWVGLQNTTFYELRITDATGCTTTDDILISVQKQFEIYVATGFTPNGDLVNQYLFVQGDRSIRVIDFKVFDRWGELIFMSQNHAANDPNLGWDGVFQGQPMPTGVYGWTATIEFTDGMVKAFQGNATLVR